MRRSQREDRKCEQWRKVEECIFPKKKKKDKFSRSGVLRIKFTHERRLEISIDKSLDRRCMSGAV